LKQPFNPHATLGKGEYFLPNSHQDERSEDKGAKEKKEENMSEGKIEGSSIPGNDLEFAVRAQVLEILVFISSMDERRKEEERH